MKLARRHFCILELSPGCEDARVLGADPNEKGLEKMALPPA